MDSSAAGGRGPKSGAKTHRERSGSLAEIRCGGDLTVALQDIKGVLVLALRGELGSDSRRGLQSALNAVFHSEPVRILIDASSITECDRRGLGALIDAADRASDSGIPLAVGGLAPRYRHMLQRLWRPTIADALSHPTLERALAAVSGQPAAGDTAHEELFNDVLVQRSLLASRVIEQAKGVLMATYGLTSAAAEESLRRHSAAHNITLRGLAERLIAVVQYASVGRVPVIQLDALLGDVANAS